MEKHATNLYECHPATHALAKRPDAVLMYLKEENWWVVTGVDPMSLWQSSNQVQVPCSDIDFFGENMGKPKNVLLAVLWRTGWNLRAWDGTEEKP